MPRRAYLIDDDLLPDPPAPAVAPAAPQPGPTGPMTLRQAIGIGNVNGEMLRLALSISADYDVGLEDAYNYLQGVLSPDKQRELERAGVAIYLDQQDAPIPKPDPIPLRNLSAKIRFTPADLEASNGDFVRALQVQEEQRLKEYEAKEQAARLREMKEYLDLIDAPAGQRSPALDGTYVDAPVSGTWMGIDRSAFPAFTADVPSPPSPFKLTPDELREAMLAIDPAYRREEAEAQKLSKKDLMGRTSTALQRLRRQGLPRPSLSALKRGSGRR